MHVSVLIRRIIYVRRAVKDKKGMANTKQTSLSTSTKAESGALLNFNRIQ